MAEAYGNQVQKWRAYVKAYVSSQTDTTATIKCETYFQSIKWGYDTGATASATVNGKTDSTGRFTAHSGSGQSVTQHCVTKTLTVNKGSSARNVWCSGTVNLIGGYHNGSSSAGCNVLVYARSYYQPRPPKNFAVAYSSDTSQKLTWQGDYTGMDGGYPWATVHIERRTDGGQWVTIANLKWDAVNYTDNSTGPNHKYEYRAYAKGAGGTSVNTDVRTVWTTPAAPASVTLSKTAGTMVRVGADVSGVRTATSYEVESNLNGSGWGGSQATESFPISIDVGGGRARVRVRSVRADLKSAWTESDEIATITPPLAPAVTGLPSVAATGSSQTLAWSPNHPDGSAQVSAEVEYAVGDAVKTVSIQGDADTWQVPAEVMATAKTVSFRVRTKGLHASWGAWSSAVVMVVAVAPAGFFTSPASDGFVVESLPLRFEWDVTDATGIASQSLRVSTLDGTSVIVRALDASLRSAEVGIGDGLLDNTSYKATLDVRGGSSLGASIERLFRTKYNGPAEPVATITTGDGLSASILISYGIDPDGELPDTVSVDVVRADAGGSTAIARGLSSGQTAIDPLPPLNVPVTYVVTARSDIGTVTEARFTYTVDSQGFEAYNFGRAAERCHALGYDASGDESFQHSGEAFNFALGPDAPHLPTFYPDGDLSASGRHSYTMVDLDAFRALRAEARRRDSSLCWFRDAFGNRSFCTVSMSFGYDAADYGAYKVSATLEEVVWEEPANA